VDYEGKDTDVVGEPDPAIVGRAADLFEDDGDDRPASTS
jgi:hypothetical protein